ncbi:hypothetical protein WJX82_002298 [Trebouxia sp. C0006]
MQLHVALEVPSARTSPSGLRLSATGECLFLSTIERLKADMAVFRQSASMLVAAIPAQGSRFSEG